MSLAYTLRTKVKVCGIRHREAVETAINFGADALGFVFYSASKRAVSKQQFLSLTQNWPAFVSRVGLWVNPKPAEVWQIIETGSIDLLQFHGNESPAFCEQFKMPYIKALRPMQIAQQNSKETQPLQDTLRESMQTYQGAAGILLDAGAGGVDAWGGTGQMFDWSLWPHQSQQHLILAGGLTHSTVVSAIMKLKPYAVDVSGGVESTPGIKDNAKLEAFLRAVKDANCVNNSENQL